MFTAAVCDDERATALSICGLIRKHFPECETRCFMSGETLMGEDREFDIILLDVKMDGADGMETARLLRERGSDSVIIFITGLKEYVFDAFDVNAFNYLLKPVDEEKFCQVMSRAAAELSRRAEAKGRFLLIKKRDGCVTLPAGDIYYIENEMRKLSVHTKDGSVSFYGSMSSAEEKLGSGFFRCHRGYLVNMEHIAEYDTRSITLSNGERVYMAKEKYRAFVKSYMRFLQNKGAENV